MEDRYTPRLCGGTFFVLLLMAMKQRTKIRNKFEGGSDGLTETNMFTGLIKIINPNFIEPKGSAWKKVTSHYKQCKLSENDYLPFQNHNIIDAFDNDVKNNYDNILEDFSRFTAEFIDTDTPKTCSWLCRAIIELIAADTSIADDEQFYIQKNGVPMKKKDIISCENVYFNSFLLGVWHYIVMNRQDNMIGLETYEHWHEKPTIKGGRYKFISSIGRSSKYAVNVLLHDIEPADDFKTEEEEFEENGEFEKALMPGILSDIKKEYFDNSHYNLFVIPDDFAEGDHFVFPRRILTEFTSETVREKFSRLDNAAIEQIKNFPTIVATENRSYGKTTDNHYAAFGYIRKLTVQDNGVKIYYSVTDYIPQQRFNDYAFDFALGLGERFNELNRAHWTIKNVNIIEVLQDLEIFPQGSLFDFLS